MKRQRKRTEKPLRPFSRERIDRERQLLQSYGLRRKREIWRTESIVRNLRRNARELLAKKDKKREEQLISKLNSLGLGVRNVDDVLTLSTERILDRRLQTIVFKKGLARTLKHARQMIVHGHVAVDERRARYPSMLVGTEQESKLTLYGQKPKEGVAEKK